MFAYVIAEPGQKPAVIKRISLMNLGTVTDTGLNELVVDIDDRMLKTDAAIMRVKKRIEKTRGTLRTSLIPRHLDVVNARVTEAMRTNRCWMFFDIDSTLTREGTKTIHPKIHSLFSKMSEKGIWIFFASGRSVSELIQLTKVYSVDSHAIAENGGVIVGYGSDGYTEFGDKTDPDKVANYIQTKYGTREDMHQCVRHTEVIFLQKDVTMSRIKAAIRATKAKVEVHPSKNSYHISKKGINKGTAMIELCSKLHSNDRMVIAVGDSDMDIPMLKNADYSFAVGNASNDLKNVASKVLSGEFEKGVEEIFRTADLA